ncbi:hypothetical protein [Flavobacterium sp. N1994]|uniref:hypothetical protein n=1 Tax=Flavobacterium sp. N1994 TaxID=2986827 RepID=UPI00222287BF|nr:hypothetical protein [Flavobacterium sp. N1994]
MQEFDKKILEQLDDVLNHPNEQQRKDNSFDRAMQRGKMKWQKTRNKMTHLTPKKKKRK